MIVGPRNSTALVRVSSVGCPVGATDGTGLAVGVGEVIVVAVIVRTSVGTACDIAFVHPPKPAASTRISTRRSLLFCITVFPDDHHSVHNQRAHTQGRV